jgi:hypothetical protein
LLLLIVGQVKKTASNTADTATPSTASTTIQIQLIQNTTNTNTNLLYRLNLYVILFNKIRLILHVTLNTAKMPIFPLILHVTFHERLR